MTDYGKQLFGMLQQDAYEAMAQAVKEAQRENALEYRINRLEKKSDKVVDALIGFCNDMAGGRK